MSFQPENQDALSTQLLRHENRSPGSDLETWPRNEVIDSEADDPDAQNVSPTAREISGSYSLMHPQHGHNTKAGPELESTNAEKLADPMSTLHRQSRGRPQFPIHPATPRKYRLHPLVTTDHEHKSPPAPISPGIRENVHDEDREVAAYDTDSSWGSPGLSPIRAPYTYKWDDSLFEAKLDLTDAGASRRIVRRWSVSGSPAGIQEERRSYPPVELKDGKPGVPKPIAPSNLALPFDLKDGESVQRYVSMITSRNRLSRFSNIRIDINRQNREKTMDKTAMEDARVGAALQVAVVRCKATSPSSQFTPTARFLKIICTLTFADRAKHLSGNDLSNKTQSPDDGALYRFKLGIHPFIVQTALFLAAFFNLVLSTGVLSGLDDLIQPYVARFLHMLFWICGILRLNRLIHVDIFFTGQE
ncbi:hypothetical protein Plec18170_009304 [Paecilomyces lecythidis]